MIPCTDLDNPPAAVENIDVLCDAFTTDFARDNQYRASQLSMTASENYPSRLVRALGGGMQGAFYAFEPPYPADPGEWHFPDSGAQASMVAKLVASGRQSFHAETFDWRPNGGAAAEQAVLLGCCSRGDAFMHFGHQDGGHTSLEELARKVGIDILHLPVHGKSLLIDVDRMAAMVRSRPETRLVILDQSFKLRWQALDEIREALPPQVCLAYDASHDGGLILGGVLPQPLKSGADILLGNTHKTIPGPQKGYIAFARADHQMVRPVSDWLCPFLQSNSHAELIAPFYFALEEMRIFGAVYARQIVKNAKALALCLHSEGLLVLGESFGYTETHQVIVMIGSADEALATVAHCLAAGGIRYNNIEIPGGQGRFGLRLGVQALTRRGMVEIDMAAVARFIARIVVPREFSDVVRTDVARFLQHFPLDPLHFSFDAQCNRPHALRLLEEMRK